MGRPTNIDLGDRDTGQEIYDGAVDLMFLNGYHGTSLRDVSKAVGLQMSSLYYYFGSKEALLVEIMDRTIAGLRAMVEAAISPDQSPSEQLRAAITAHIRFHAFRPKEARVADSELRSLSPDTRQAVMADRDAYELIFREIVAAGQRSGAFAMIDTNLAVRGMLVATTDVADWYVPHGRLSLQEIADTYTSLFLKGLDPR